MDVSTGTGTSFSLRVPVTICLICNVFHLDKYVSRYFHDMFPFLFPDMFHETFVYNFGPIYTY